MFFILFLKYFIVIDIIRVSSIVYNLHNRYVQKPFQNYYTYILFYFCIYLPIKTWDRFHKEKKMFSSYIRAGILH